MSQLNNFRAVIRGRNLTNTCYELSSVDVTGDGYWIKKKTLAMFPDVTAEHFHVTPAARLNDSPANYSYLDIT